MRVFPLFLILAAGIIPAAAQPGGQLAIVAVERPGAGATLVRFVQPADGWLCVEVEGSAIGCERRGPGRGAVLVAAEAEAILLELRSATDSALIDRVAVVDAAPIEVAAGWAADDRATVSWLQRAPAYLCGSIVRGETWINVGCGMFAAGRHVVSIPDPEQLADASLRPEAGDRLCVELPGMARVCADPLGPYPAPRAGRRAWLAIAAR